MLNRAHTVIVGAGIVGVSAAAELVKRGVTNVVVVEQGSLFQTGGSSSHAPGGVFQNNASRTVSKLAQWSVETFNDVSAEGPPTYFPVGSIEIATTEARWHDLHRKQGYASSWGLDARLLSPAEVAEMLPLLDVSQILGGIHVAGDGVVRSVQTVERLAARAASAGVRFLGQTAFTGTRIEQGRVRAAVTSAGEIECENLLLCGGIWGPLLGAMCGIDIPLQPCVHPLVRSTPLPELASLADVVQSIWRHQDHSMYLWQDGEQMAVGNYRHEPRIVSTEEIDNSAPAPAERPWDEEAMAPGWCEAQRLVPALRDAGVSERVNGMFSFTPDANSLIGEIATVKGLWTAIAIWVTHAGGAGRAIADLMTTGDCELDLREVDPNRFAPHQCTRSYVQIRGGQQYREVYDIIHPRYQIGEPRGLRRAPWYDQQVALGAHFFESNGWERAQWYESNQVLQPPDAGDNRDDWSAIEWSSIAGAEHLATRTKAGLFDLSTFMRIELSGADACAALRHLSCSPVDRPMGKVGYILMLTPGGGITSDVTYLQTGPERYLILTGSASGPRDLAWIAAHARHFADLEVRDVTAGSCALGLWGPTARAILVPLLEGDLSPSACPPYSARQVAVAGVPVTAVRMSYVGEDGFELHTSTDYANALWDAIWTSGQSLGLVAAGGAAMDTLRLERGFRALGTDLRAEFSPYESGMSHLVDQSRQDFIGAEALAARPIPHHLCTIALEEQQPVVLGKEPMLVGEKIVGYVASAGYGYTVGRSLATGYLPVELAQPGTRVSIEYFGERCSGTVVADPLYSGAKASRVDGAPHI